MTEPLALWHAEHVNFARLLDLRETEVVTFHATETPNYDLMVDIVYYLRNFGDRCTIPARRWRLPGWSNTSRECNP